MAHPLFGPEIREMLADRDEAGLRSLADTLHPATVAGPHSFSFRHPSDCVLTANGMQLQLNASVYPLPFLMQIGYYAARPVTLAVAFVYAWRKGVFRWR